MVRLLQVRLRQHVLTCARCSVRSQEMLLPRPGWVWWRPWIRTTAVQLAGSARWLRRIHLVWTSFCPWFQSVREKPRRRWAHVQESRNHYGTTKGVCNTDSWIFCFVNQTFVQIYCPYSILSLRCEPASFCVSKLLAYTVHRVSFQYHLPLPLVPNVADLGEYPASL